MKRRYLYFVLILFCLHNISYSQIHSGYIVKSIDKLFIIDCGKDDGIQNGSSFKIYNHLKGKGKSRTKNDFEFFGTATYGTGELNFTGTANNTANLTLCISPSSVTT